MRDILDAVLARDMQLFVHHNSAAVTELIQTPRKKICNVFLCGGDMDEIRYHIYPDIEEFARREKCDSLSLVGRKGWMRSFLKDEDWSPDCVVLTKELNG